MANRVVMVDVQRIRELARGKNMNLNELEAAASVAHGVITKWANADARLDKLYRVSAVLETSIDDLIKTV